MQKVALVTGAAKRIGAAIAELLHKHNYNIIIHYRNSGGQAKLLAAKLNKLRPNSATILAFDLNKIKNIDKFATKIIGCWGRLDLLVNNASQFYKTPLENIDINQWEELFNTNVKAAFFLSQALAENLTKTKGNIVNIIDTHVNTPIKEYSIYIMAKAACMMMTKSLARELAPEIRVNAIGPGAMLWPEDDSLTPSIKTRILAKIPLKQVGCVADIAKTVYFLSQAEYITGDIIFVDGGRHLYN